MASQTERGTRQNLGKMEVGEELSGHEQQRQSAQYRHRREELQTKMEEYINSYYS